MRHVDRPSPRFFQALPVSGPWSAVGLSRSQFLGVLGVSLAAFLVVGGPLWRHLHDGHLPRITVSYALIPLLVAVAQWWSGRRDLRLLVGASALLCVVKLVLTAGLTVALGIAG